jgi:hypothetical protein
MGQDDKAYAYIYGPVNRQINWDAAPPAAQKFLQNYNLATVNVMEIVPDWQGVKSRLGVSTPIGGYAFGVKTDFSSSFDGYTTGSMRLSPGSAESISLTDIFGSGFSASSKYTCAARAEKHGNNSLVAFGIMW